MGTNRFHRNRRPSARKPSTPLFEPLDPRRLLSATPAGTYPFGGKTPATLTDADGTAATFSLPTGQAAVTVAPDGSWHVSVSKSTPSATLTITSTNAGDARISLADLTSSKPLRTLNATKANLTGLTSLSNVKSITLGNASDLSLSSSTPLTSLTATSWTDADGQPNESLTAPSLSTLTVKRDFSPNFNLSSPKTPLKSATIGGTVTGGWSVSSPITTLKLHAVRTPNLFLAGPIKQLTLDEAVTLTPGPTSGAIHLASTASVSAAKGKDKFKTPKNTTFYTGAAGYSYPALSDNSDDGAARSYRRSGKTHTTQISAKSNDVPDVGLYTFQSPGLNGETDTYAVDPADGTRLLRQDADSDGVSLGASFAGAGLPIAPPTLTPGATARGSNPVTLSISDEGVGGTLHGNATSATRLASHELVSVPAGTFLAAKVVTTLSFNASGTIGDGTNSAAASVTVATTYTQWFVPGLGPVRTDTARSVTIKVPQLNATRTHHTSTRDELSSRPAGT